MALKFPWTAVKAVFGWIFATAIILLVSFNIITLLPSDVFATIEVEHIIEATTAIALILGAILHSSKLYTSIKTGSLADEEDWKRVFRAALVLAVLGALASLVVMSFPVYGHWSRKVYFASVIVFVLSLVIPPHTLATFDDRQENNRLKKIAYIIDRYLLTLYVGVFLQINFLEAKETLEMNNFKDAYTDESSPSNFSFFLINTSNGSQPSAKVNYTDHFYQQYNGVKSAAYAILTELMGLLFMCHIEQRRLHKKAFSENCQNANVENQNNIQSPSDQSDRGGINVSDRFVFAFGLLSLTPLVVLIVARSTGGVGKSMPPLDQIVVCFISFFLSFNIYEIILLCSLQRCRSIDYNRVSSSLDILLLRLSAYGMLLFISLIIAALICGPVDGISSLARNLFLQIFNAVQVSLQYAILINLFASIKNQSLKEGSMKLRIQAAPILLANTYMWVYNLWQWKSVVTSLPFADARRWPGPVWEVMEALLYAPAIFFRFHSAFLTFMISGCSIKNRANEQSNPVSLGNVNLQLAADVGHSPRDPVRLVHTVRAVEPVDLQREPPMTREPRSDYALVYFNHAYRDY